KSTKNIASECRSANIIRDHAVILPNDATPKPDEVFGKHKVCLAQCQTPLLFLMRHGGFRQEALGCLHLGLRHGAYCIGCCWVYGALVCRRCYECTLDCAPILDSVAGLRVLPALFFSRQERGCYF